MKRIAMMVSTIAMALALTACGGEEQKATTWSESHYEEAQETQGEFAYAEDAEPERWLIVKPPKAKALGFPSSATAFQVAVQRYNIRRVRIL